MASEDARVKAIRNDEKVGRGSCSSVDECMTDSEIIAALNEAKITTIAAAIKWARKEQSMFLEQGLNQRWGEDDDPQLLDYKEFHQNEE